jgi:predicted phosphodiesterase
MALENHFSSVLHSVWQSIVARRRRQPDVADLRAGRAPIEFGDSKVLAATAAAQFQLDSFGATNTLEAGSVETPALGAAQAALDLAHVLVTGTDELIEAAQAKFAPFGALDPFWVECITQFVEHYWFASHARVPYVEYRNKTDFVLPPGTLPETCRIGIFGDWGTGDARAQALLEAMAADKPDIAIHLGDIYYSCTASEANTFYQNVTSALPNARIFTLCGNHDMYSGGGPYYSLLNRIGQPASFFCLRNRHWQILAGDTGYKDFSPFAVNEIVTSIRDRDPEESYSELDWHKEKLINAGSRRTMLLTHHQPFSRNSAIGGRAVNDKLLGQFKDYLPDIALWLWGHEHNQVIYAPFLGVERGRCLGASAIPVPVDKDLYGLADQLAGQQVPELLAANPAPKLQPQASGDR